MKRLASVILVAVAIVLAAAAPGDAMPRHGFSGGHPGGHFDGHHRFDGHRGFRRDHVRIFVAPLFFPAPVFLAPAFAYAPRAYWYYCPSYGAYYPYVPSCPEPWVPVLSQ